MSAQRPRGAPAVPRRLRRRHIRVLWFFARTLAGVAWWDLILRRLGFRRLARNTAAARYRDAAARFRLLATDLGGVWIKVGQFLSSRVDVLPESITAELSGLQDEVAPESFEAMRTVLEAELGAPLSTCFADFDPLPLASASLGQVHRARLPGGEAVVVKVQRPDIRDLIAVDLAALKIVIGWLKRYPPIRRRADLDMLFGEFSRTLWEEVDYQAEAANAVRFGEMFAGDADVRVPAVHMTHTTDRVLTLEDVYFIKITDYAAVEAAGVDRAEAAARLLRVYLRQIFQVGFFHADPHPGNLFVEPLGQGRWRLVFVDFGMVGRLEPQAKRALRELAIAVGARDAGRLLKAFRELGVLLPGADEARIREAVQATLFDRFWGKSMRELMRIHPQEMRQFAGRFRDLLFEMPFQLPGDLIFLGRCVAILSGMCTGLDPEFNLFAELTPFAQQLLAEEGGGWLGALLEMLGEQGGALLRLPARLSSALDQLERGQLTVSARAGPELDRRLRSLTTLLDRLVAAVVFTGLLLAGTLLTITGERIAGAGAIALAFVTLIWLLFKR